MLLSLYKSLRNVLGTIAGWSNVYNADALNQFTPAVQAELASKFLDSMVIKGSLPGADGMETYVSNRPKTIDDFPKLMAPDGVSISKKLEGEMSTDAILIRESMTDILRLDTSQEAVDARADFKKNMEIEAAKIKSGQPPRRPGAYIDKIFQIKAQGCETIKRQHELELSRLTHKFNNQEFKAALTNRIGIEDAAMDAEKTKWELALKSRHKEQLAPFEKGINEPLKGLLEGQRVEFLRIAYLAGQYNNHKKMQQDINNKHEENKAKHHPGPATVSFQEETNTALFEGVNIDDFKKLYSATGRTITVNKEDGSFTMSLPNHFFRADYYSNPNHNSKRDIASIVEAIRAQGHDSITMNIDQKNPEHALEFARQAYEACLEAGFEPKNINIVMNGKKMTTDELFKDCRERLQISGDKASKNKAELLEKIDESLSLQTAKEEVTEVRNTAKAAPTPSGDTPAPSRGPTS